MFEISPRPEFYTTTKFKLSTNGAIAAGAIVRGQVDLNGLKFLEDPEVPAQFSIITQIAIAPVVGLEMLLPAHQLRLTPALENDVAEHFDVHRQIYLRLENISDEALEFTDTIVRIAGVALPPSKNLPAVTWPALVADDLVLSATDMDGVALAQRWTVR